MHPVILWLPIVTIAAHLVEEFVWPGGFADWYRHYPPGATAIVSTRFLVIVNCLFAGLALIPPALGPTEQGYAWWVVVACIAGANGLFHLVATLRTRRYSPGLVTGVAFYLPLAGAGSLHLLRHGLVATATVAQACAVAAGYQAWSTWRHQRHRAQG